jgi:uncharacterized RDD family membrane protein YckC
VTARCPRCLREAPDLTAFCAGCGAPLLLPDEPPPRPLDEGVELDRRGPRRADELADLERSSWDLGGGPRAAVAIPEPAPAPAVPAFTPVEEPPLDDLLPDAEVEALEIHVERAAAGRRVVAWLVDAVPFAVGAIALASFLVKEASPARTEAAFEIEALFDLLLRERTILTSVGAVTVLCLVVYTTLAHALGGATLGKALLGLRVIGPDGGPPSPVRSAVRSVLALVSAGLLGLGFLVALFTRSGRGLHDFLARTWVVKAP